MTVNHSQDHLDPRRSFTREEVTAVWIRQNRKCNECTREVPRDLIEGDHIVPWSTGGATSMDNLQALCVACNRRKGIREGFLSDKAVAPASAGIAPLRSWQERALEVALKASSPVLIEACPGAGKTRFGLEYAARMFVEKVINRVLIVVPTRRLVSQWVEAGSGARGEAVVPLAPAGWRPTQALLQHWCGAAFTYHALFAQTVMIEALVAEPGFKTLLIFDEIHHVGNETAWGLAAQEAVMNASTRILSLSGTAFRTRGAIAFTRTYHGRSIADYTYSYGDALVEGVCRPLRFIAIGGTATFQTREGIVETVSFDDDLNEQGESYRLRTVLSPDGDHLREMLRIANEELTRLRTSTDPDAGGVVVCIDCDHADSVARLIETITGTRPTVAYSRLNDLDDPSPQFAIEAFSTGTSPWIVSVRMVSEGVDIRRLRVLVYATSIVTELAFRQITGRVVRTDAKNSDVDYGIVVLPAEPRLLNIANRLLEEAALPQRESLVMHEPRTAGNIHRTENDHSFIPLGSTGELAVIIDGNGRSAPADLFVAAKRYVEASDSKIPPFEVALAAAQDDRLRLLLEDY